MNKTSEKMKEVRQKRTEKKKYRTAAATAAKKAKMTTQTKAAEDENNEAIHLPISTEPKENEATKNEGNRKEDRMMTKMITRNNKNKELNQPPISTKLKENETTKKEKKMTTSKDKNKEPIHLPISTELKVDKAMKKKKEANRQEDQMMRICCILTISDSSSKKPELDQSGPLLAELLQKSKNLKMEILDQSILADEKDLIIEYLCKYSTAADCILTTGGTGMGRRDVTPEATKEVIERECLGIVTAILMHGLQATPFAALTRLAAGIRNNCLIVNLPGSPKAVSDGFEVLDTILPHAIALLKDKHEEIGRDHQAINSQQNAGETSANAVALI